MKIKEIIDKQREDIVIPRAADITFEDEKSFR